MQTHIQLTIRIYRNAVGHLCGKFALEAKVCSGVRDGANRSEAKGTEQNAKVSSELGLTIVGASCVDPIGYLSFTLHGDLQACCPAC